MSFPFENERIKTQHRYVYIWIELRDLDPKKRLKSAFWRIMAHKIGVRFLNLFGCRNWPTWVFLKSHYRRTYVAFFNIFYSLQFQKWLINGVYA